MMRRRKRRTREEKESSRRRKRRKKMPWGVRQSSGANSVQSEKLSCRVAECEALPD